MDPSTALGAPKAHGETCEATPLSNGDVRREVDSTSCVDVLRWDGKDGRWVRDVIDIAAVDDADLAKWRSEALSSPDIGDAVARHTWDHQSIEVDAAWVRELIGNTVGSSTVLQRSVGSANPENSCRGSQPSTSEIQQCAEGSWDPQATASAPGLYHCSQKFPFNPGALEFIPSSDIGMVSALQHQLKTVGENGVLPATHVGGGAADGELFGTYGGGDADGELLGAYGATAMHNVEGFEWACAHEPRAKPRSRVAMTSGRKPERKTITVAELYEKVSAMKSVAPR